MDSDFELLYKVLVKRMNDLNHLPGIRGEMYTLTLGDLIEAMDEVKKLRELEAIEDAEIFNESQRGDY